MSEKASKDMTQRKAELEKEAYKSCPWYSPFCRHTRAKARRELKKMETSKEK